MSGKFLYVFLDEAGNLDFSPNGTRYFTLSSVTKERPFHAYRELAELRYDFVEAGLNIEYFHASEDSWTVRHRVFDVIERNLGRSRVDSLIVDKRKTEPSIRPVERFYPRMLGYLLRDVLGNRDLQMYSEVIVFTDRIPVQRKREAVEKAVKVALATMLPQTMRFRLLHHDSKSSFDLQIVDYCNWAIYRKWDRGDVIAYNRIRTAVLSEFDIFHSETRLYW